ncbi:MAG: hypothetical protein R3A13_10090 [Bdellovibrionota bacterium]
MMSSSKSAGTYYNQFYCFAIFLAYYYILKLPIQADPLLHYDDAEALYHTLALIKGKIPHLEDATHHSFGYVLPFFFLSKIFGFSEYLLRHSALLIQPLTALAIFLSVRCYQNRLVALLCGLLYLSAREPWVNAFYPQYLMNFVIAWMFFALTKWIRTRQDKHLLAAFLIAGLGLIIDQRLLALVLVPSTALALENTSLGGWHRAKPILSLKALVIWIFPITIWILYLAANSALSSYLEQTFIYPLTHRSASVSLLEHLLLFIKLNIRAFNLSPFIFTAALTGMIYSIFRMQT